MSRRTAAPLAASAAATRMGVQMMEMAVAVPQVMAHRLTRMALAGTTPSPRDRREFDRMGAEKLAAFQESWLSMAMQGWVAQQRLAASLMRTLPWPWGAGRPLNLPGLAAEAAHAGQAVLGKGLAPVHRRAVANARRLGRTALR